MVPYKRSTNFSKIFIITVTWRLYYLCIRMFNYEERLYALIDKIKNIVIVGNIMATSVKMTKADEGNNTPPKIETFDDILPHVGEAGWYQLILFVMLLPLTFAYGFLYFTQFFLTLVPEEHWCTVPELNNTAYNLTVAQK